MKRLVLLLVSVLFIATLPASAQGTGGFRHGNKQQWRDRMKARIKDELKLTDVQADTVMKINQWYQGKINAAKNDGSLTPKEQETQVATLQQERKAALKAILTDEQVTKLQTMLQNARMRQQQTGDEEEITD